MSRLTRVVVVALGLVLGSSSSALARPAIQPSAAPSTQRPKPIHGKQPAPQPKPVEPWTQTPKYGAPWKKPPAQTDKRSPPIGGSAFEFFFWIWALLGVVASAAWVRARRKSVDWELRSAGVLPTDGSPQSEPTQTPRKAPRDEDDAGDSNNDAESERLSSRGEP